MTIFTSTKQISSWIHEGRAGCLTSCEKTPGIRSLWSTRGFQKPVVQTIESYDSTWVYQIDKICFLTSLCWTKGNALFSYYLFSRETPTSFVSPRLAHWWVINMRIRSTTVSTSPSYQEIFGLVSSLGFSRLEKSGHENVFENTKRWQYKPETHCTLSNNWLLHQLYHVVSQCSCWTHSKSPTDMTWIKHTPMQVAVLMCCKMWGSGVILTCVRWFDLQIHSHPFLVWWPEHRSASRMTTWFNKINHNCPMEHLHVSYLLLSIPLLFLWFLSKINRGSDVRSMHCTCMKIR